MQTNILGLRYHMKEILQALDRNETVEILYHGKPKGIIVPFTLKRNLRTKDHPYFGMTAHKKSKL